MLSDVVAERVVRLRRGAGLGRDELAERCRKLGADDLTADSLANIETGRRLRDGTRRRRVTVDEWTALAVALDVPPAWLLADPHGGPVSIGTGVELDPWAALLWTTGRQPLDGRPSAGWTEAATVLDQAYQVATLVERFREVARWHEQKATMYGDPHDDREADEETQTRVLRGIAYPLKRLVDWGVPTPPIPADVADRAAELEVDLPQRERDQ